MKSFFLIFSMVFCYQGELLSYEFMESFSKQEVQESVNADLGVIAPEIRYDVTMYKLTYNTIDPFGQEVIASGVIAYPENNDEAFPIISWQHGTEVKRDNVTSIRGFNVLSNVLTGSGYIFLEPDYLGLGDSEIIHPYCIKEPSAWTTIDLIRAAKSFLQMNNEIESNNEVILFGYSEGGYVTMAAHKIFEQNNLDEFNLIASFPMAGPYDLSETMVDLMLLQEPYGEPFYLPYVLVPYITYYDMGSLYDFFLPEYASMFGFLFDGNYSGGYINSIMPEIPIQVLLPEVIEDFTNNLNHPLRLNLSENDLYDWSPISDMYLFHGIGDELIPYENSLKAYNYFINNGSENVNLYLAPSELGGHSQVAEYCLLTAYNICEDNYKNIIHQGDLNNDSILNIQDLIIVIDYILNDTSLNQLETWQCDFDSNLQINIQDIILFVERILSN